MRCQASLARSTQMRRRPSPTWTNSRNLQSLPPARNRTFARYGTNEWQAERSRFDIVVSRYNAFSPLLSET